MKTWIPRDEEFAAKVANTGQPLNFSVNKNAGSNQLMPEYVANWLAQARLLYGVPFEYQVCDQHYLPVESMRFFYLDRNWTDALVDGAMSIGLSSRDVMFKTANVQGIQDHLDKVEKGIRSGLRGVTAPANADTDLICGFLLRSAVVSGYPGMEVGVWKDKERTSKLPILRLERLSPDILVCLFSGKPEDVSLQQPPEGLHFGVRQADATKDVYSVILRQVSGDDVGMQFKTPQTADVAFREGSDGVLDITKSVVSIQTKLLSLNQTLPDNKLDSSAFAIQMVRASGLQEFKTGVPKATDNKAGE